MDALDLWNKLKSIPPTQNRLAIQLIEDYSTTIRKECAGIVDDVGYELGLSNSQRQVLVDAIENKEK